MVEHQETIKEMENLNIIIELNEDGKMENFDIALRGCELPYENTDEYEYEVEEFEKTKELQHKQFNCLLARELNCFACVATYRFQLIFVKRKRKVPVVEYAPTTVRNTIITSVPIVRQAQHYQQSPQKVVSMPVVKNLVKTVPMRNTVTYQQQVPAVVQAATRRVVIAQQQPFKKEENRQQQQQPKPNFVKKVVTAVQKQPQNLAQRIVYSHATKSAVPDIGSSEEDIETEVIDSSMVEVEMPSNSNSPLPKTKSKVVVQREPRVSVMSDAASDDPDPLKCDLCDRVFHSLRQRERHRVTHTKEERHKSLSEEGVSSPTKQSPNVVTKATNVVKRMGPTTKRAKLSDPLEVTEEVTAGEDSEN